jgi:hypothetical protein
MGIESYKNSRTNSSGLSGACLMSPAQKALRFLTCLRILRSLSYFTTSAMLLWLSFSPANA